MEIRISLRKTVLCLLAGGILGGVTYILTRPSEKPSPVPRREALPRVEAPEADYTPLSGAPICFEINTAARSSTPDNDTRPGWFDISYPPYDFTIHLSFVEVEPDEISRNMESRLERMDLNLSGRPGVNSKNITGHDGFEAIMVTAPPSSPTPVQFVATDGCKWIVSGVMFVKDNSQPLSSPDLYAPQVDFVRRDIIHALHNLRYSN